jgi:hypothetical protein
MLIRTVRTREPGILNLITEKEAPTRAAALGAAVPDLSPVTAVVTVFRLDQAISLQRIRNRRSCKLQ